MDWHSEHVRTVPVSGGTEGQMVRLTGHRAPINESQGALEAVGTRAGQVPRMAHYG